MQGNFQPCLKFTLAPAQDGQPLHCTPGDPGGETDEGITLPSLAVYLNKPNVTVADLQAVADDPTKRSAFYFSGYWMPPNCEALPKGIDLMVCDFGVTDGPVTSAKILQMAAGFTDPDGAIGPVTLAKIASIPVKNLILSLAIQQYRHIAGLNPRFQNGWRNRVARAEALAQQWNGLPTAPLPASAAQPVPAPTATSAGDSADALMAQEQARLDAGQPA
jgi:lysozyme family protein